MALASQLASPRQGYAAALHWPPGDARAPQAWAQPAATQPQRSRAPLAAPSPPAARGSPRAYGAVALPAGRPTERRPHALGRALVFSHALALLGCCAAATVLCLQLGMDRDVAFWIGRWGLLALLVPAFLLAMFVLHLAMLKRGTPNKRIFIWAIVAPGVFFCVMGGVFMQQGSYLYGQLKSSDCSGSGFLPEKKKLQDAYDVALSVYGQCVTRLYYKNGQEPLESRPTLFDCDEWDNFHDETEEHERRVGQGTGQLPHPEDEDWAGEQVPQISDGQELDGNGREIDSRWPGVYTGRAKGNFAPRGPKQHLAVQTPEDMRREWGDGWSYLASVEADHICSGWCQSASMLWTSYETGPGASHSGGKCTTYVAQKFLTVSHLGRVILFVELLTLIIAYACHIRLGDALIELGYK